MSSSATMAPVIEIEVSVPRPCILIIDDDKTFLEVAREFFSECGYEVDITRTPEKARQILKENENKYQLVATDINFGDLSQTQGDKFVLENRPLFGKAKTVIISAGEWLTPERLKQLKMEDISYFKKTRTLNKKLAIITQEENDRWAKDIKRIVTEETVPSIKKITGGAVNISILAATGTGTARAYAATGTSTARAPEPQPKPVLPELVTERMKGTLIKWLRSRGELDEPVFAYGKHVYSANDMIKEVQGETEVGLDHVQMLLGEFEHSLEVDERDSRRFDDEYAE